MAIDRDAAHYRRMMRANPCASVGASLAAHALTAADDEIGERCDLDTDYQHAIQDRHAGIPSSSCVLALMGDAQARRELTTVQD